MRLWTPNLLILHNDRSSNQLAGLAGSLAQERLLQYTDFSWQLQLTPDSAPQFLACSEGSEHICSLLVSVSGGFGLPFEFWVAPCIFRRALVCWLWPILPAASLGPRPRANSLAHSVQICSDPESSQQHSGSEWPWASLFISLHLQGCPQKGYRCRTEIWKDAG